MNWAAIGVFVDLTGLLIVIATLIYLAREIDQGGKAIERANDHARASSVRDTNNTYIQIFSMLAADAELAAIYGRALKGEELDEVEAERFKAFTNVYFAFVESLFQQVQSDLSFSSIADEQVFWETGGRYMAKLLQTDAGGQWWREDAPSQFTPDYIDAVKKHVLNES
jgi:hypothetical protein